MKLNVTQKLVMTLALWMLATSVAWANYIGYTHDYIEANGLVFRRLYAEDPTGQTCTLVKPSKNNKNVYAECNEYGQGVGPAEVPEGMAAEVHVGPDGDEYTKEIYEIPSIVQGAKVVRIESNAFKGNTHLKSITFPAENLTSIPGNGFAECTALESLNFSGTSIKVIGTAAFAQCTALKKIEDWGQVETIHGSSIGFGYGCFGGCTALTELKIGPSVKYIYGNTFGGCTSLTKLIFEDGDDWLELSPNDGNEGAATLMFYDSPITYFYCGRKLTNNAHDNYIGFVNPLTTIEESVRKTIPKMEVEFGEKIDTLRNCVFRNMDIPIEVRAPGAVAIADYAFEDANVKSIDVPKIKFIDKYAFSKSKISEMNFYSVEEIGNYAFQHSRLTNVSLPATLKYIGVSAFDLNYTSDEANEAGNYDDTSSLKTFTIEDGDEPIELGFDRGDYEKYKDETDWDWTIFVYSRPWLSSLTLEELYIGRPVAHEPVIKPVYGTVQDFSDALNFRANSFPKLKKVELTKVTMIDDAAFQAGFSDYDLQSSLEEVSLPMLKAVPSQCFYNCPKLKKVSIPKAETIWNEAFAYASADLDLSFINTVDSIKERCFMYSSIGPELTIPASLKFLGTGVFSNCESLKKVTFEYGENPLGMEYSFASNNLASGRMVIGGGKCGIEEFYFDRNVQPCTYIDESGETPVTYTYRLSIARGSGDSSILPNLKTVTIGKKLTSLNGYSFEARELEYIRCENPEPIDMEWVSFEDDPQYNATHTLGYSVSMGVQEEVKLIVPEGSASDYLTADVWKGFKMIVDEKGDFGKHVIPISKAGQLAYFCDRNLDFSNVEGLKAYIATGYDKTTGTIWLTRVKDVPAKTGIYLVGSEKNYEVPIVPETKSYYVNYLLGSIDPVTINETNEYTYINYYLSNGSNGVGFYRVNGTQDLPAYRSYLQIPYNIKNTGSAGETERIEISAGQLAYSSEKSLDFTDLPQVRAYTATGYEKGPGTIWLTRVKKVPARTGILIMADNDTYEVPTASMQCCYQDMFVSVVNGATIYPTESNYYTNYYLSNGTAGVGFYKVTKEEGVELKANRCYLQVPTWMTPSATAGTRGAGLSGISFQEEDDVIGIPLFRGIDGNDDGTTSIKDLTPALSEGEGEGEWYTLQGQRVAKPGKGLYIRNGKKVVVR